DRHYAGTAPGRGADRVVLGVRAVKRHHHVICHIGRQARLDTDRPHTRATAPIGYAEGLVQIHVRHVVTEIRPARQTHQGFEIVAIHVHLPAGPVHYVADLAYLLLVHAVGRRVGDHQAGQVLGMGLGFGPQIVDIDVTLLVAGHQHHTHAGHLCRGRVGTVGRGRNETDIPVAVAIGLVKLADRQQSG